MDSSVRATGTMDGNRAAFNPAQNLFKNSLNCRKTRLHLPAVEVCAVIRKDNPDATIRTVG